ncbi:type VI secretion system baseplate subunit TssK [Methylobacter sp. G7]
MYNRLSRVLWTMGQALLPAHLRALEESLLADSALRFSRQEAPGYGLYRLRWNGNLLIEGVLSLDEMTLVLFSGLLLELKANAQVAPLNLNIPGTTLVPVYVHVRCRPEDSSERDAGSQTIKRDNVNCWLWSLELSTEQENPDTLESFRLAEFEKQPDGSWRLSSRYIPPLVCLGSVPFLKEELTVLVHKLEAYHYQLTQEIAAIYLSGADLVNAKQCLKSVVQMQRFLANLFAQISPHPYTVYEQLKHFYVDLCFYHNNTPQFATSPYRHEQLAEVFRETLGPLNDQLQLSQMRSPYLPFALLAGIVRASLPESIREAKEIYLLVQKGGVTKAVSLDGFKIAAVSRIPIVHKFYLQGIPCKRMERPPFQNSFGPEVDIYQISLGEEWDHALDELALGFYADPKFTEENFFLYWRSV